MLEKFEYPAVGTVTNSWLPSRNPSYSQGPPLETQEGIISQQSSGDDVYNYGTGRKVNIHRRRYTKLAASECTSYLAFRDVVGGDLFKFTDYTGGVHTVTFAEFSRAPQRSAADRAEIEFTMREAL